MEPALHTDSDSCFLLYIYPFLSNFIELSPLRKMSISFGSWALLLGLSQSSNILLMQVPSSVCWQILGCFFLTASEVMISITCLEFAYTQAPRDMKSLVGLFLTVSLGNFLTSQVKFLLLKHDDSK